MEQQFDITQIRRRDLWWRDNESTYGSFFPLGYRSFNIFANVYRNELKEFGALVRTGFGTMVHSERMHEALKMKICGTGFSGKYKATKEQ